MADRDLMILALAVELEQTRPNICLIIPGAVLKGTIVSVAAYHARMQAQFPPESPGDAAVIALDLHDAQSAQESDPDRPRYLYLTDIELFSGSVRFEFSTMKLDIAKVVGWTLESFAYYSIM